VLGARLHSIIFMNTFNYFRHIIYKDVNRFKPGTGVKRFKKMSGAKEILKTIITKRTELLALENNSSTKIKETKETLIKEINQQLIKLENLGGEHINTTHILRGWLGITKNQPAPAAIPGQGGRRSKKRTKRRKSKRKRRKRKSPKKKRKIRSRKRH